MECVQCTMLQFDGDNNYNHHDTAVVNFQLFDY